MSRFAIATVAVFIVSSLLNFLIHGLILKPTYMAMPDLTRTPTDSQAYILYLMLGFLFFSIGFVGIYAAGVNSSHWVGQGLHYGVLVWLVASVSRYFIYYAIQPWPFRLVLEQIGLELVMMLLLGLLVAAIGHPGAKTPVA